MVCRTCSFYNPSLFANNPPLFCNNPPLSLYNGRFVFLHVGFWTGKKRFVMKGIGYVRSLWMRVFNRKDLECFLRC